MWHDGAVKSFLHTNLKSHCHPCCVHLSSYYSPLALLLFALLFSCMSNSHKTNLDHVSPQNLNVSRCLQCFSIHHYPQCLSMMFLLRYYSFYCNKVKSAVIQYDHDVKKYVTSQIIIAIRILEGLYKNRIHYISQNVMPYFFIFDDEI